MCVVVVLLFWGLTRAPVLLCLFDLGFVGPLLQVELVRAPEGSVVGERVRVEGSEGEPLTPAQVCQPETPCEALYQGGYA